VRVLPIEAAPWRFPELVRIQDKDSGKRESKMRIVEVIEARVWVNKQTGLKVSPYGACPWTSESDKPNWEKVQQGWTWRLDDGTVGCCRVPAKTREEAAAFMVEFNDRGRRR